jgi:nitrate reductase gamma subunit
MTFYLVAQMIAAAALVFSLAAFAWRLRIFNRLAAPADRSPARGDVGQGVLYAYTLGMAPWSKESTRRHWASYLRGVAFHLGIFLCLVVLVLSPWVPRLPVIARLVLAVLATLAAVFGLIGFAARAVDANLKALSTPDDLFAVLMVSLFLASGALWLAMPAMQPVFYMTAAAMLVYAPFGKIRHCIYFAYARLFFGRYTGRRGVLPHSQQHVSTGAR